MAPQLKKVQEFETILNKLFNETIGLHPIWR